LASSRLRVLNQKVQLTYLEMTKFIDVSF